VAKVVSSSPRRRASSSLEVKRLVLLDSDFLTSGEMFLMSILTPLAALASVLRVVSRELRTEMLRARRLEELI